MLGNALEKVRYFFTKFFLQNFKTKSYLATSIQYKANEKEIKNMSRAKKIVLVAASVLMMVSSAIGVAGYEYFRLEKVFNSVTIELGNEEAISDDIRDYVIGNDKVLEKAELDSSQVDVFKTGEYKIYCNSFLNNHEFDVRVVDTVAPLMGLKDITCVEKNTTLSIDDLVDSTFDLSNEVIVTMEFDGAQRENVKLTELKDYTISLTARDASNNEIKKEMIIKCDEAPSFMFLNDRDVVKGSGFKLTDYVVAYDNEEGIISDRIQVNSGNFDINVEGDYPIEYTITDKNGLSRSRTVNISVGDKNDMRVCVSDKDIKFLDENGYFRYEVLDEGNKEISNENTRNACVALCGERGFATGFVYDITPEYTYIMTAKHCTGSRMKTMHLMFENDRVTPDFKVEAISCKKADLAMFKIPTSYIDSETLLNLKETHIDKDIYSKVKAGDEAYICSSNWNGGEKDLYTDIKLRDVDVNRFAGTDIPWNSIIYGRESRPGQSGSGVYDTKGNLIGILYGEYYSRELGSYFGVSVAIDHIDELLERIDELG